MCSGGGDQTAKAAEQQSANFQSQLMGVFQKQYGQQSDILKFLTDTLKPQIENPQGYSPEALAAMRTSATDQISGAYGNAEKALQNQQFINGSENLPSGVNAMQTGAIHVAQAGDEANAQNQLTVQNENVRQGNYWNAINALSGNAAQYNPQSYAGASSNAGGTTASLSNAFTNSNQSQLLGALGGIAGGVGSALSGRLFPGCWLAAAVFGENFYTGVKTALVRRWLWTVWAKNWYAKPVLKLYSIFGEALSQHPRVVRLFAPLFHSALRKAQEC